MSKFVQAKESFSSETLGYPRPVVEGETFHDKHKIVKAHPNAFEPWVCDNPVEATTAAPGEKRRTRIRKREKATVKPSPVAGKAQAKGLVKADRPGAGKSK